MSRSPRRSPLGAWRAVPRALRVVTVVAIPLAILGGLARLLAPEIEPLWQAPLSLAVAIPMATAIGAGIASGQERLGWIMAGLGLVLTGIAAEMGMPSGHGVAPAEVGLADVVWLCRYPLLYGGLALLMSSRAPRLGMRHLLDGLVGAFAAAALFALVVHPWMVDGARAADSVVALRSLYPVLDVLVLGFLAGAAALNGWPVRTWLPLVLDMALLVVFSVIELRQTFLFPAEPIGWATFPGFLVAAWALSAAAFALQSIPRRLPTPRRPVAPSLVLAGVAVVTLMLSAAAEEAGLPVILAGASLLVSLVRQAIMVRDNDRLLALSRAEAATDALTGLGNRRSFMLDLAAATKSALPDRPLTLALYDLDGFKHYNDTFGHPAGDSLLQRLGLALRDAVEPAGRAYRMGGDEFCVLLTGHFDHAVPVAAGRRALAERGEGFDIGASCGTAAIPHDTGDAADALRLADGRMYAEKGDGRRSAAPDFSAIAALLQVVRERDPALESHVHEVADWASGVAKALGADPATVEQARLGGELHDIGKTAIPDAILNKPGPLTDEEWDFMRRHTVIGERILLADAALSSIAPVARSHHERWDGGGYPDGTVGDDIPLAARIVSVCDAFEAMVADRPYRRGRSSAEAVAELLTCRGGQFDPDVVDAFIQLVTPDLAAALLPAA